MILIVQSCSSSDVRTQVDRSIDDAIVKTVINPRFPRQALVEGLEGYVRFEFDINEKGSPENIRIVQSEPEEVFDKHAFVAFKQWVFKVKKLNGVPVRQEHIVYTLEFNLH
jgi:protein TonB